MIEEDKKKVECSSLHRIIWACNVNSEDTFPVSKNTTLNAAIAEDEELENYTTKVFNSLCEFNFNTIVKYLDSFICKDSITCTNNLG